MDWVVSNRSDPRAIPIADRHYSRQSIGAPNFVPPGRCFVLITPEANALWATSWPFAKYVRHAWAGAWMNSFFRNESQGQYLSSGLIRQAVAATRWRWPKVPDLGMVTFIDRDKVKHKRDFGRCYLKAGFHICGETKGGLLALQLNPEDMPEAIVPEQAQNALFDLEAC